MNNFSIIVDKDPQLLLRIRHLARQNFTKPQILDQLHQEGYTLHQSTLDRITKSYCIPVMHATRKRKSL